jgi:hypothetical protein
VLRKVAHINSGVQHPVAQMFAYFATFRSMGTWRDWRKRAKEWKEDNDLDDAVISAAVGRKRATVNSWLNKREPNLSDFMALCEAMGADPGLILFEQAVLPRTRAATAANPIATPHTKLMTKLRTFKQKRRKLANRHT